MKRTSLFLVIFLFLLFGVHSGAGQSVMLVKDIRPGAGNGVPINTSILPVGGTLFFNANNGIGGTELWKSNGTTNGTVLVKDINSGTAGSIPIWFGSNNGTLFFSADDGVAGKELWKSDGTPGGTILVKDINAGSAGSFPTDNISVNGTFFFLADDGVAGRELWKSDGIASGTVLVKDINPGSASSMATGGGAFGGNLAEVNGTLFFTATDGSNGVELWKSDGSSAGTVMVKDINPNPDAGSTPTGLTAFNGLLFFAAFNPDTGGELWQSDGTAAGTVLVKDINPGQGSGFINLSAQNTNITDVNGTLFFRADGGGSASEELWKSDGTANGTVLVKNINASPFLSSNPDNLTDVNGTLFFVADDGTNGNELWQSDGTADGTVLLKDVRPGQASSNPHDLIDVSGIAYFVADDGVTGEELWRSDGTGAGTVLVEDINADPSSSIVAPNFANMSGTLFFRADDGIHGGELWKTQSSSSTLTITATPQNPPVIIPAGGGFFDFDVTITNNTASQFTGNYWNTVTLPIGEEIGPQLGPFNVSIAAGQTFSTTLTMEIPSRPPPATYGFNMKVGTFPNTVLDSDSFNFTKTGGPNPAATAASFSSEDWAYGEEFIPAVFELEQNYPNPFNPATTIGYSLPQQSHVVLKIYDILGRDVASLVDGIREAGSHEVAFEASDLTSGFYVVRLQATGRVQVRRMLLLK